MKLRKNEAIWVEARNRWQINVTNADGKRKTFCSSEGLKTRKGKLQAERKADDWLENGVSSSSRVEEVFESYIQFLQDTTSQGNWRPCKSIGKHWILPAIGTKKIERVTEGDLEGILTNAFKAGMSKQYISNIRDCLSGLLKFSRKRKLTTLRPEELSIPNGAKGAEKSVLTPDEIRVLFKDSDWWYIHAYRFFLVADLRPGELLGLQWGDIDGNVYTINRSYNVSNEITAGKNFNARRTLRMSSIAEAEINAQREMLKRENLITPWVFPTPHGFVTSQDRFRHMWYQYCASTGIGERGKTKKGNTKYITPYEFRHTCYSVNKDMPEALKKIAFGHSRKFDGDTVYSHEMDGDRERIASYTDEAFERILTQSET